MEDFRLKVFVSAAKNLSFTKAAEETFISQPAVTNTSANWKSDTVRAFSSVTATA